MIESSFNQEENIIYVKRSDEVDLEELMSHIIRLDKTYNGIKKLNLIDDFGDSVSKFQIQDFPDVIEDLKKRIQAYDHVNHAVIVTKPLDAALSYMFTLTSQSISNYTYRTFSSLKAAKSWLYHL